jgi:hypothetical protein
MRNAQARDGGKFGNRELIANVVVDVGEDFL